MQNSPSVPGGHVIWVLEARSSRTSRARGRDFRSGPEAVVSGGYENFPHARSVAHQISLLPPMMTQPNAIHT